MPDAGDASTLTVRPETAADHAAIAAVVRAAFGSEAEAGLVEAIRASEHYLPDLALVAERQGTIVGHVMISYVGLRDDDGGDPQRRIASLSPLAVAPDAQRQGVGKALVREVTRRADDRGEPLVVLEGDPTYYGRFGFEPAAEHGITITLPDWAPPEAAQVLRLRTHDPAIRGHVVYPPAFDSVTNH